MTTPTTLLDEAPSACTLPTVDRPLRLGEFDQLFAEHVRGVAWVGSDQLQLTLTPVPRVAARAADLVARESACCSFFTFTLTIRSDTLDLGVAVPAEHHQVLVALAQWAETAQSNKARGR